MRNINEDYIIKRCNSIQTLLLEALDNIELLDKKKKSIKSKTMEQLLDKDLGLTITIFMNYVEIFKNLVNFVISSYEIDSIMGDKIIELSKRTYEFTKNIKEFNKFIKSEGIDNLVESNISKLNCYKNQLNNTYIITDFFIKNQCDILYLSILSFSSAINTNDFNRNKKLKESILNFITTTIEMPLGELAAIKDFVESITQILNTTDNYYLMTEFIENTDENLIKIETQIDALMLVLNNQQMIKKTMAEISENSKKLLQSLK